MARRAIGIAKKSSASVTPLSILRPRPQLMDCAVLRVAAAMTALSAMAGPDGADPFSRDRPLGAVSAFPEKLRLGVPRNGWTFWHYKNERGEWVSLRALKK